MVMTVCTLANGCCGCAEVPASCFLLLLLPGAGLSSNTSRHPCAIQWALCSAMVWVQPRHDQIFMSFTTPVVLSRD